MPPTPLTNSWPSSWYPDPDHDAYRIVCPAEGCSKDFHEDELDNMITHWNNHGTDPKHPSHDDHVMLLAMMSQTKCVHKTESDDRFPCDFDPEGSPRALLNHEQTCHGRSQMSTIEGYLELVREGHLRFPREDMEVYAFSRLVRNIARRDPQRDAMFQYCRPYRSLSEINDRKVDWIETILQDHNKQYGRRPCAVIPSEHFLASLTPSHDQVGADWRQAWEELRSMYAQGTI